MNNVHLQIIFNDKIDNIFFLKKNVDNCLFMYHKVQSS